MHGLLLAHTLDWSASRRVCDVGGGDGTLLGVLLAQHPHLDGVLLDLPDVVARATPRPRLTAVGGDAFVAVPRAATPTCSSTSSTTGTTRPRHAAAAGRRGAARRRLPGPMPRIVIVVESEAHARPRDDVAVRADLLMLALTPGGRERTTDEVAALALAVLAETEGLSRQEIIRRAVLERYERTGHRSRVEQSAERLIDRWGDVLDRLGSV
jgi:hypothetical protein